MSRAERLLELMQCLRGHRLPVSGAALAGQLGISLRSLYRDIASLQAQGAQIVGEAGVGYVLRPGFTLPPLMFTPDEVEALALGSRWVADRADGSLAEAAHSALAKIASVVPSALKRELDDSALLVGPSIKLGAQRGSAVADETLKTLRLAIRHERKLHFAYTDEAGQATQRTVWPFALGFFETVRVLVAWCEARQDFRHFRADRMSNLLPSEAGYPRKRQDLLKIWRANQTQSLPKRAPGRTKEAEARPVAGARPTTADTN